MVLTPPATRTELTMGGHNLAMKKTLVPGNQFRRHRNQHGLGLLGEISLASPAPGALIDTRSSGQ